MRGEHGSLHRLLCMSKGSSPHARGARDGRNHFQPLPGIIPACAGSTRCTRRRCRSPWDHPRMRGEHCGRLLIMPCTTGSSPHARGARAPLLRRCVDPGIIPACAGSTSGAFAFALQGKDHPRMRGEHESTENFTGDTTGSSPHARGALRPDARGHREQGIIPACAGSTMAVAPPSLSAVGSSPHARGAQARGHRPVLRPGIIPACAGSTAASCASSSTGAGSSPHARGALYLLVEAVDEVGIIPACAGSTWTSTPRCCSLWDHPRMRGEHRSWGA